MFDEAQIKWIQNRLNKDSYKAIAIVLHNCYSEYLHFICDLDNDYPYLTFSDFLNNSVFTFDGSKVHIKTGKGILCPEE